MEKRITDERLKWLIVRASSHSGLTKEELDDVVSILKSFYSGRLVAHKVYEYKQFSGTPYSAHAKLLDEFTDILA